MSGDLAMLEHRTRGAPPALASPRFLALGTGTLAYTAAGCLDLLAGGSGSGNALSALSIFALLIGGTFLLLRAVSHPSDETARPERPARRVARRAMLAGLALAALLALAITISLAASAGDIGIYDSDAAAFNAYNAELVLHGRNPYTADAAFWDALRRFPSVGATPLRAGAYAESVFGPPLRRVIADVHYEQTHPAARGPEYDPASLHSYPALAFLIYMPGVWAGMPTTFYTSLLVLLAFLLAAGWGAPRRSRLTFWLLLAASPLLAFWTLRGSFEVVALLPALLAWRLLDRYPAFSLGKLRFGGNPGWLSPVLLGLACAVKQLAWPLVPLYVILVWKRQGARAALVRLGVAILAFLAPNLPFLVASPGAWVRSMLLPVTLPIFPSGVGLVGLARAGLTPLLPSAAYALLELAALVALAVWIARTRHSRAAEVALVLGLMPFALSWHSLFPYFMCIPALAVACSLAAFDSTAPAVVAELSTECGAEAPSGARPVALQ